MSRARECGTPEHPKRRYATREEALDGLFKLARGTGAARRGYQVYKCRQCGYYHVGHAKGVRH